MKLMKIFRDDNVILIVSMVLLALLILIFIFVDSKAAVGLTGVIIGGILSSVTAISINRSDYQKQLRLAALEKRLEAHQQAFAFWWEIRSNIYNDDKISDTIQKATEWWRNHCLYLGPKSRASFYNCLIFAGNHADMLKARTPGYDDKKEIRESWDTIMLPGSILVEEVNLPSFGEEEYIKSELEKNK